MKTIYLHLALLLCLNVHIQAQDYKITFSGSGESNSVDSIIVQNLTQGTSLKMSGSDTLLLQRKITAIKIFRANETKLNVYPNPSSDESNVEFVLRSSGDVKISLYDISGKQINALIRTMESGLHQIRINGLNKGIYIIKIQSGSFSSAAKIVSYGTKKGFPVMNYHFLYAIPEENRILKSTQSSDLLPFPYLVNDNILITAESSFDSTIPLRGVITLQMTEEPEIDESGVIDFEFVKCVDACGNSYATVEIGDQTWMAENLYCKTTEGSWVYEENPENEARYGRLYNWGTAMANAPKGWHLPSIDEWKQLFEYLLTKNNNDSQFAIDGIKSSTNWFPNDDQISGNGSNTSGMSLLPGGLFSEGDFYGMGLNGNFWTSTVWEKDTSYSQVWRLFRWNTAIGMGFMTKDDMGISVRYIKDNLPAIITQAASGITDSQASFIGSVKSDGGQPITECGIYWSKINPYPDADDSIAHTECKLGLFEISIENLEQATTYYYRAFAKNNLGTSLGEVVNFTTNQAGNNVSYNSFMDNRGGGIGYKTIKIGEQIWMAENLRYLPAVSPPSFYSYEVPVFYVYGNTETSVHAASSTGFYGTYGVLYNWSAAATSCPAGWHLPSSAEWKELTDFIKDNKDIYFPDKGSVASSLAAQSNWSYSPNVGSAGNDLANNNSSGFSALPGGMCQTPNLFPHIETQGYWWSSSQSQYVYGMYIQAGSFNLSYNSGYYQDGYGKTFGFSVRCVKDK